MRRRHGPSPPRPSSGAGIVSNSTTSPSTYRHNPAGRENNDVALPLLHLLARVGRRVGIPDALERNKLEEDPDVGVEAQAGVPRRVLDRDEALARGVQLDPPRHIVAGRRPGPK